MRSVMPEHRILSMLRGEEALALIERAGRTAYKSEDKAYPKTCDMCQEFFLLNEGDRVRYAVQLDKVGSSQPNETTQYVDYTCPRCGSEWWLAEDREVGGRGRYLHLKNGVRRQSSSHKFVRKILKTDRLDNLAERFEKDPVNAIEAMEITAEQLTNDPPHESVIEHGYATVWFRTDRGISHELVRHRLASYTQQSTRYVNFGGKEIEFIRPSELDARSLTCWEEACKQAERRYKELLEHNKPEVARAVLPNCLATEIVVTANYREWRHIFNMRCSTRAHPDMQRLMKPVRHEFRTAVPIIFDE